MDRWRLVRGIVTPQAHRDHVISDMDSGALDLRGQGVYSNAEAQCSRQQTNYDIANAWQQNYVRGKCTLEGQLLTVDEQCHNDDAMFGSFHLSRRGSKVLDVGCNTGKNMMRAIQHGGLDTEVFGIEFSHDSAAVARHLHGEDHVFQGDASSDFVGKHSWQGQFSIVQCTAVLQHLTPAQADAALCNMSKCLRPGGELLLTFKDAPTKKQMHKFGMGAWADEVFTADVVNTHGDLAGGWLKAVMWDDDYYPGVTGGSPPLDRSFSIPGIHRREFVFYSLEWMKATAEKHGLTAKAVEVMPDSKIPFSALHWMVIFQRALN